MNESLFIILSPPSVRLFLHKWSHSLFLSPSHLVRTLFRGFPSSRLATLSSITFPLFWLVTLFVGSPLLDWKHSLPSVSLFSFGHILSRRFPSSRLVTLSSVAFTLLDWSQSLPSPSFFSIGHTPFRRCPSYLCSHIFSLSLSSLACSLCRFQSSRFVTITSVAFPHLDWSTRFHFPFPRLITLSLPSSRLSTLSSVDFSLPDWWHFPSSLSFFPNETIFHLPSPRLAPRLFTYPHLDWSHSLSLSYQLVAFFSITIPPRDWSHTLSISLVSIGHTLLYRFSSSRLVMLFSVVLAVLDKSYFLMSLYHFAIGHTLFCHYTTSRLVTLSSSTIPLLHWSHSLLSLSL